MYMTRLVSEYLRILRHIRAKERIDLFYSSTPEYDRLMCLAETLYMNFTDLELQELTDVSIQKPDD